MGQIAKRYQNASPPEQGRIRFGKRTKARNGRERPTAIKTWRFTSPDETAIKQIAGFYGGEPQPWFDEKANPQNQFEVFVETDRISVWLPSDSLSILMEKWGGRGIERRCDGETCTYYGAGSPFTRSCWCEENEPNRDARCKPYSRLNVLMPICDFGGVWRLEVKGEHFAHEAPSMIDVITQLQAGQGMVKVDLLLTERTGRDDRGQITKFIVPKISVAMTPEQMLTGQSQVRRLAIEAPVTPSPDHPSVTGSLPPAPELRVVPGLDDDEVVDAEVVEDMWHHSLDEAEDNELTRQLEQSVVIAKRERAAREQEGWDIRPMDVAVMRNPDPNGPKWVRKR